MAACRWAGSPIPSVAGCRPHLSAAEGGVTLRVGVLPVPGVVLPAKPGPAQPPGASELLDARMGRLGPHRQLPAPQRRHLGRKRRRRKGDGAPDAASVGAGGEWTLLARREQGQEEGVGPVGDEGSVRTVVVAGGCCVCAEWTRHWKQPPPPPRGSSGLPSGAKAWEPGDGRGVPDAWALRAMWRETLTPETRKRWVGAV